MGSSRRATVYFVEWGPGDPGLLTVRGRDLLARADHVLADPGLDLGALGLEEGRVEWAPEGVRPGEVGARLVERARAHAAVVRLLGGDALLSGRGAEEALTLLDAGVGFEIVPGVAAGLAGAAYAGIPWSARGIASAVVLASEAASGAGGAEEAGEVDWGALARSGATAVIATRRSRLSLVGERLRRSGFEDAAAACVGSPTQARQWSEWGTLSELMRQGEARGGADEPVVLVVGGTAGLGPALEWFQRRPLFGRRIVVTRSRAQAADLLRALAELGAEPIEFPTIRVAAAPDPEPLRSAARSLERYDWVVFTSVNGVDRFWRALREVGRDARAFGGARIAAIGPGTARALAARGLQPDRVPQEYVAEGVLEALAPLGPWAGRRVLLPRAAGARDVLPRGLEEMGARVDEVAAYTTEPDRGNVERLREALREGRVDAITFTASSTVRNFVAAVGAELDGAAVAAIGPITARTARELGLPVHIEAEEHTISGLLDALCEHFRPRGAVAP